MINKGGAFTTEFSEFTYGYALTRDIEHVLSQVVAVPSFPSLIEEGTTGGYDVRIERPAAPLFIQFKIPRVIKRRNSRTPENGLVDPPYFRMYLHKRDTSNQHELLLDLLNTYPDVFYASPKFDTKLEIDNHHRNRTVAVSSLFVNPGRIGPLRDDEEHYVIYSALVNDCWYCSKPEPIEPDDFGDISRRIASLADRDVQTELYKEIILLCQSVSTNRQIDVMSPTDVSNALASLNLRTIAYQAAYWTQVVFDCQLFVVTVPEQRPADSANH